MFNDTVLYVLLKKPGTKDEFDDLTAVSGQEFTYDYPAKKKEEVKPGDDWPFRFLIFKSSLVSIAIKSTQS